MDANYLTCINEGLNILVMYCSQINDEVCEFLKSNEVVVFGFGSFYILGWVKTQYKPKMTPFLWSLRIWVVGHRRMSKIYA